MLKEDLDFEIYGPAIRWKEHGFLSNPNIPKDINSLTIINTCRG